MVEGCQRRVVMTLHKLNADEGLALPAHISSQRNGRHTALQEV